MLSQKQALADGVLDGQDDLKAMKLPSGRRAFVERMSAMMAPPAAPVPTALTEQRLRDELVEAHGDGLLSWRRADPPMTARSCWWCWRTLMVGTRLTRRASGTRGSDPLSVAHAGASSPSSTDQQLLPRGHSKARMETRGPNSQDSCDIAVSCVTAKEDRPEIRAEQVRDEPRDRHDRRQFGGILLDPAGGLARFSGTFEPFVYEPEKSHHGWRNLSCCKVVQ